MDKRGRFSAYVARTFGELDSTFLEDAANAFFDGLTKLQREGGSSAEITVRFRQIPELARRMRQLRACAELTQEEVAERCGTTAGNLLRKEGGYVGFSEQDVVLLLMIYGVEDQAVVDELRQLAREGRSRRS